MANVTDETLNALKAAQSKPETIEKATTQGWQQATGLVYYDLRGPAKLLYPVITPLRNMIPRVAGRGGTATNWKAITAINTTKLPIGVLEGKRSGFITNQTTDYTAAYAGIGLEDFVTFEADYAGENFDDVKARAVESLLRSFMIAEEQVLLGGNRSLVTLGTCPTPTVVAQTTPAGSFASGTAIRVFCVALTLDGYQRSSVSGGVLPTISRTPGDGIATADTINGGCSRVSAVGSVTPGSSSSSIYATVAPVRGAVAYAWYWGTSGNELLGAITTTSQCLITATATGTQNVSVLVSDNTDRSKDATVFDGILSECWDPTGGSYYAALANPTIADYNALAGTKYVGTALRSDTAGGIVQIDDALRSFWDNFKLSPDLMIVSAQELKNMTTILIKSGGASLFQFNMPGGGEPGVQQLTLSGGSVIGQYLNKFTMAGGQMVRVMLHPNMPPGTILFYSRSIPYPLSGVGNVLQVVTRRDYYQIEWPIRTRRWEYGVYADELLQNYFPPAFGTITNIADGVA